tara:strand:- start:3647 stop:4855 length:1209 start_codon:yes stop_codon:yes gene_type:complete
MKKFEFATFDTQYKEIEKEIEFCTNCVVSNQRPRTKIINGVCAPCIWSHEKDYKINWPEREKELKDLLDKFRKDDGSFDVVVPGSGGKDSFYVAHQLKHKYGMNPLCCTWAPFEWSHIGWKNFRNWTNSGFPNITCHQNGSLHRKLSKLALELVGDAWQPFTYGQKSWAFHIAEKFDIKLIFYGENGEVEYGGSEKYKYLPKEGPDEWEYEYFKGAAIDKIINRGLETKVFTNNEANDPSFKFYRAPDPQKIIESGIEMHWYSYYKKWIPQENYYYAAKYGNFRNNHFGRSEGTYTKHVSLDDMLDGFHWYLSYMKFGMGRCSRDVQTDIRRNHITRREGVKLVNKFDGEFPKKYFSWFLNYLEITEEFFWEVMDYYRNISNVWELKNGKWKLKEEAKLKQL